MASERNGMVEKRGAGLWLTHAGLILGILFIFFPIWLAFVASTVSQPEIARPPMPLLPGDQFWENYAKALTSGINAPVALMLFNSAVMAIGIAVGKIVISLLSAFAIVYFRFPGRHLFFWLIFLTLMLPVEVRIVPTYEVAANFGMLNSYSGLILPLIASATATFLFRQFFMTVPDELAEAARVDGARPMRFFWDILLPMSRTNIAALFVILFIYGWNQYLWPLLITTDPEMNTIVMGIKQMFPSGDDIADWPARRRALLANRFDHLERVRRFAVAAPRMFVAGKADVFFKAIGGDGAAINQEDQVVPQAFGLGQLILQSVRGNAQVADAGARAARRVIEGGRQLFHLLAVAAEARQAAIQDHRIPDHDHQQEGQNDFKRQGKGKGHGLVSPSPG